MDAGELSRRVTREAWLRREVVVGFITGSLSLAIIAAFAWNQWPGDPHHCAVILEQDAGRLRAVIPHECFCENFDADDVMRGGPGIRQPANTMSNLFPFATGLWLALVTGRDRVLDSLTPPRKDSPWGGQYPMILMLILGFMAPGSMVMHASLTHWGGLVDQLSMLLFVYFLLAYGVVVRYGRNDHAGRYLWFWIVFGGGVSGSMAVLMTTTLYQHGHALWLLWPAAVFALVEGWQALTHKRGYGWFWAAILAQVLAFVVWGQGRFLGDPMCRGQQEYFGPNSWLQAHGLWHVFANVAALLLFFHFRQSSYAWERGEQRF